MKKFLWIVMIVSIMVTAISGVALAAPKDAPKGTLMCNPAGQGPINVPDPVDVQNKLAHGWTLAVDGKCGTTPPPPPPAVCTDPAANNVGQPLPCTYDEVPPAVCTDPAANNVGQPLPCTYDGTPPVVTDPTTTVTKVVVHYNCTTNQKYPNDPEARATWYAKNCTGPKPGGNVLPLFALLGLVGIVGSGYGLRRLRKNQN